MNQTTIGNVTGNNNIVGNSITINNYDDPTSKIKLHDIESLTGTSGTLRACLKSDEQPYIPLDDSWVENQLTTLITTQTEPHISKPLVIKGFGRLGKTRLALEICRLAKTQYQAKTLLLNNAHADLNQLITEAKQQKQHLILLIDDCLEFFIGANKPTPTFDDLVDDINHTGEGWVHLVVTLRYLPNDMGFIFADDTNYYQDIGVNKLNEYDCCILDLNEQNYQEWRINTCEKIYSNSKEYEIDNPLVATLVNYCETKEPNTSLSKHRLHDNNEWLLQRLFREFREELSKPTDKYQLTYLLLLFPFDNAIKDKLDGHLYEWVETLERAGFVYHRRYAYEAKWELAHDLLADIGLSEFLSSHRNLNQRHRRPQQFIDDAKKIEHAHTMMASLARGIRRAVAQNPLSEALDLLSAFGEAFIPLKIQKFQQESNEKWYKFPEQALCSLSLSLSEKIRIFEKMPELRVFQIDELIKLLNDEVSEFQKLIDREGHVIYRLVIQNSYGNKGWFNNIRQQLNQNEWEFLPLQLDIQLCRKLCLHSDNTDMMKIMDFYYQDIIALKLSKQHRDDLHLLSVGSIFDYAFTKCKQENDFSVYLTVWEQFDKDEHDEIRLQAAKAAQNYAWEKAQQESNKDITFNQTVWEQFKDDKYSPIQQEALSARLNYINWQIAWGQVEIAYQDGLALLNHPLLDKDNNAALHFLLWLAQPTPETQQACENAIASLNGEAIGWKFDEFAERISSFSDENQAYAKRIIQLLEQG